MCHQVVSPDKARPTYMAYDTSLPIISIARYITMMTCVLHCHNLCMNKFRVECFGFITQKTETGGMAWSDDGKFVKIEQRPQDRSSLWHWIRSSINWCPSAISSIYRKKDNLLSKEVRVEFLLTKFCNRTFRSQVYQKHIKFTSHASIGLQIYLRMNMMKRKNINETVASDCGWAVIGTCLALVLLLFYGFCRAARGVTFKIGTSLASALSAMFWFDLPL